MWGGEEDEASNVNLCLKLALGIDGGEASSGMLKKHSKGYYPYPSSSNGAEKEMDVDGNTSESDARGGRGRNGSRRKLQLTKEQTQLLEGYFRWCPTLDPAQKHELAQMLNLQPRQVEVWFQNRRARTKMKQTEEECEVLKRCCESLREENQRLKMELCDLKTCLGSGAASTSVCSSCCNNGGGGGGGGGSQVGKKNWWFN